MRSAAELRSSWRSWLALAVLAGLSGGVVVAAAAGARRTDSALARHVVAYRFPDVSVGNSELFDRVRALPQVAATSESLSLAYVARDARGRPVLSLGPHAMKVEVSLDGRDGAALGRWKLLAGRRPHSQRRDEALVDSRAAKTLGVGPGGAIRLRVFSPEGVVNFGGNPDSMHAGRLVELRVVGVKAATDTVDDPGGVVRLTPAFYRAHSLDRYQGNTMSIRLEHGAADIPAFRREMERKFGSASFSSQRDETARVQRSIHLQVQALRLAAALGGMVVLMLLFQALLRLAAFASLEHPILRAVGMTRKQLFALGMARSGAIALAAAGLTGVVAAALSPLSPIGLARELEPDPGFAIDPLAVPLGSVAVLVALMLAGAVASWRAVRTQEEAAAPSPSSAAGHVPEALARWGLPATAVSGVRLALSGGRGAAAAPVAATLLGGIMAVAVAGTALTFSASLRHLFSTPRLYGQTWDYELDYTGLLDRTQIASSVRRDRAISDAALGAAAFPVRVRANGESREVSVRAMDDVKGAIPFVVIDGRAPAKDDEILVGAKTLAALGLRVGDAVNVRSTESARLRIVGRGVVAQGGSGNPATGAAMTFEGLRRVAPGVPEDCCLQLQLRFAHGADREATVARLERRLGYPAGLPPTVADFGGVQKLPLVLSALLAAVAAGALAHTLVQAVRRRRRDLAILKTLGFDRRQVLATVAWQATTFAVIGLLVGLPLGVAAGRWAWNLFAEQIGIVPEPVTPVALILLVVPGAVLLANLVAAVPGRMAARTRPALVLRAE